MSLESMTQTPGAKKQDFGKVTTSIANRNMMEHDAFKKVFKALE